MALHINPEHGELAGIPLEPREDELALPQEALAEVIYLPIPEAPEVLDSPEPLLPEEEKEHLMRDAIEAWRRARQAGDKDAQHEAFTQFTHVAYNHAKQIAVRLAHHPDDTDEIAQKVIVKLWRRNDLDKFRGDSKVSTWLHRIVVNETTTHLQKISKRHKKELALVEEYNPETTPDQNVVSLGAVSLRQVTPSLEETLLASVRHEGLASAILELKPEHRIPLVLYHVYDMTLSEIAEIMGISETNVKVRTHRARKALREMLADPETGFLPDDL